MDFNKILYTDINIFFSTFNFIALKMYLTNIINTKFVRRVKK
jgi:hypothetical protein